MAEDLSFAEANDQRCPVCGACQETIECYELLLYQLASQVMTFKIMQSPFYRLLQEE